MKYILATLILTLSAAFAFAQGAPPAPGNSPAQPGGPPPKPFHHMMKWWKDSDTVKQLQLSDAQAQQIEQNFTEHRMRFIDEMADLQKQELRLHDLLDAAQPDESQVNAQVEQLIAARGRLEKEHAAMMLSIRRVLSLEQWNKLQSLHPDDHMMGHHHMGHGDHGPPPLDGPPPPQL